jgi:membrane protease YdiL (CAAX protease family)
VAAWLAAGPVLLVLLALNLGYHFLLSRFLRVAPVQDPVIAHFGLTPLVWLAYCVQPAVVEELFFRYLALGWLRSASGTHAAVLVSSVMFGVAHIGVPLSIPMLIVLGVGLGYLRVAGGGLVLPILVHFAHNAVVIGLERCA